METNKTEIAATPEKVKVRINRTVTLYIDVEIEVKPWRDLNLALDRCFARVEAVEQSTSIPIQNWKISGNAYKAILEGES